jgi:DNA-binding CsgD family transcriptional regulator
MTQHSAPFKTSTVRATRDVLSTLAGVHGLAALIRDEDLRVRWCDDGYATLCARPKDTVIGTTLRDMLPAPAAAERESVIREVIESGEPMTIAQFGADKRLICRLIPLDESSFGHRGVLCLVREGELGGTDDGDPATPRRVLRIPCLDDLAALTKAELRTLYDLACGASNTDTAERQFRSVRTIENHVESIHKKLGTTTRSALVRFATERGLHGFTPDEWDDIVEGANKTRRAAASFVKTHSPPRRAPAGEN